MLLSVVIPVYNEKNTLFELVGRVMSVELDMQREIILVDDGSTDGTRELYTLAEAGPLKATPSTP